MNKLNEIQQNLKAPKNQRNSFGNYNYRSCEDIVEAVKPLLGEATLTISDEIIMLGDRFYVKATATLKDKEEEFSATAYAREATLKKGMDEAQITGATSSYARKYALNGLFAIDDTKDADTMDNSKDDKPIINLGAAKAKISHAKTSDELTEIYKSLTPEERANREIISFCAEQKKVIIPIAK